MARIVRTLVRFVELAAGDPRSVLLAVEVRRGARATTVGRLAAVRGDDGRARGWMGLRVGAYAWTPAYGTRKAAVDAMLGAVDVDRERMGAWSAGVPFVAPACAAAGVTVLEAVEAALDGRELGAGDQVDDVVAAPCECVECRWEREPIGTVLTPFWVLAA
jgi:hypothetical protein